MQSEASITLPKYPPLWVAAWRVRVATGTLWFLIILAAAGGIRGLVAGSPAPRRPPNTMPAAQSEAGGPAWPAGAGGFAALFVAAYLSAGVGHEQDLRAFYTGPLDLAGVTPASRYASRTAAIATTEVAPGYWAVTVGAEVLAAAPGGYQPGGIHYYRVGVRVGPGGQAATSLPAEVPRPGPGPPVPLDVPPLVAPATGDPMAEALQRFFDAYLAGHGDITATVAPGSGIAAVTPPPFSSTGVAGMASGPVRNSARLVEAEVVGTDGAGRAQRLDYALRMLQDPPGVAMVLPAVPLAPRTPAP